MLKELQESTADGGHILGNVEVAGVVKRYNEEILILHPLDCMIAAYRPSKDCSSLSDSDISLYPWSIHL